MLDFIRKIIKAKYDTLNLVEISANNLIHNFNFLQQLHPEAEIFPVLKSNAYGHGLKEVCQILNRSTAKMVAVDSYPEAQIVYKYFKAKVLILGEMPLEVYHYTKFKKTEFVIYSQDNLKELAKYGKKAKIHLFLNSGMNREGISDISSFIKENRDILNKVDIVGFCSHLASADDYNSELTDKQEFKFLEALKILRNNGFNPKYIHLGNSAGIFRLKGKEYTAFRAGLSFYGYSPFKNNREEALKPALEIKSKITHIQKIKASESVSYNEKFIAQQDSNIALIPFGYFEGLDRRLSNNIYFEVISNKEKFLAKIAGTVCMNICCLDLKNCEAKKGDVVKIISSNILDKNSFYHLAEITGSIYELLVRIHGGIRRKIL